MIALIWAESENGIIGKDGAIPWHLPNDLKYFRSLTQNHIVVMGSKTFLSLGSKPLPNRRNVVLTRKKTPLHPEVQIINFPHQLKYFGTKETIFVIGGKETFDLMLPRADVLYRTVIHADFEGDTLAPVFSKEEFSLVHKTMGVVDDKNPLRHTFEKYVRN